VEETLAVATYMEAAVESQAAVAVEAQAAAAVEAAVQAQAAAAVVRRGEERMRPEGDIFRSRFLPMLIYHVPMNLAICHTGCEVAAI
jgi:hypothetical protein